MNQKQKIQMQDLQNKNHSDNSLTYENFIRICYKCERLNHGANTDIWDNLHSKYLDFLDAKTYNNKEERDKTEKEFLQNLNEVKKHLDKAYQKLLDRTSNTLNKENQTSLKNYQTLVKESNELNIIMMILEMSFEIIIKCEL